MDLENYIERLKTMDKSYQWPIERYEKRLPERKEIHKKFPYFVTYPGLYGPGGILDEMQDWCREHYGDKDGKCHWRACPLSFETWFEGNGYDDELNEILGNSSDDESGDVINKYFEMIESKSDAPKEHSHTGIWTSFFVVKTGYDYGYEDFCFQNPEDLVHFKLIWDSEVVKRK